MRNWRRWWGEREKKERKKKNSTHVKHVDKIMVDMPCTDVMLEYMGRRRKKTHTNSGGMEKSFFLPTSNLVIASDINNSLESDAN